MALVAAVIATAACKPSPAALPAAGQLLVYLDTDAILPAGDGRSYGPLDAYPLFDHARFDVLVDGTACDQCTRDFDLNAATINQGLLSFAVLPSPAGKPAVLRARLFRYSDIDGTEPRPQGTIDAYFAVDLIAAEGVSERTVFLRTEDVGAVQGSLAAPLPLASGRPSAFHAGTWPQAARIDCKAPPRAGEVCIPGGAFWMGSALEARLSDASGSQRLVVLSPYYLGANEVTVTDFRKSGLPVTRWPGMSGVNVDDACRFTASPGDFDDFPVNCVEQPVARQYCTSIGADLPTEAQYEYAAGALRSAPYVWGSDPPTCEGVVMCQRSVISAIPGDGTCKQLGAIGGPLKVGSGKLDRLDLPTGTVVDLIGNVSEFARDQWNRFTESCWSRPGVYVDPVCTTPGTLDPAPAFSLRGGEWELAPNRASGRFFRTGGPPPSAFRSPLTGFRCARPAN
jgi:formylglycine-generating enzyme required for sulfatase activity